MEALRETALLGTEKKALDIQQLPEAVRSHLREAHAPDPEWQFLEANAFYSFYTLAGRLPSKYNGILDETIVEETLPVAPKELMDVYSRFELVDHQLRENTLNLWLDLLIYKKMIVSAERLVELIYDGRNASGQTKAKIVSVIGKKGAWILQHDTSLSYAVAPSGDHLWTEGNTQERKHIFLARRKTDPRAAIDLLRSTWDTESVVNKKTFLELIRQTSVADDLPFLEALYNTEFTWQPKEKKTEKECRKILATVLLKYPSSGLYATTAARLQQYMVRGKKGIVGFVTGQAANAFRLPEQEDDFWNAAAMEQAYGFETKNYDAAMYDNVMQFWLSSFIEYLPFGFWVASFDSDYKKAVQFWLLDKTTISGLQVPVYLQSLIENALQHNDKELALVLIQLQDPNATVPLLQVMDPADFEAFVLKHEHLHDIGILGSGPFGSERSWSLSFSERILNHAFRLAEQHKASAALGEVIAQFAHHQSIDALYTINNKARDTAAYHEWNTAIFQIVHPVLEIRNKIHALKK